MYGIHWLSIHVLCHASPNSRFQTEAGFILRDVRLGSKADENGPSAPDPLSDLKLTQFGGKRTLGHEGLLSGRQRKPEGTPLNSRS